MKKIFLVLFLFVAIGFVNSQDLYLEGSTTVVRDSIAVAGSTDAGTDWYTNVGYDYIEVIIFNGVYWFVYEIAGPVKQYSKFKVAMEGSDTTIRVQAYYSSTVNKTLPIWTTSSVKAWSLDFGGDGTTIGAVTSPFMVMFKGYYKRDYGK